jgi:branched-chain amino acid transport system substrate-binding protein
MARAQLWRREVSRRRFLTISAIAGGAVLAGCNRGNGGNGGAGSADEQEAIVVGSILDATGPINIYGAPMVDSTRFAIDDINANGGVLGRRLELVHRDGQSDDAVYVQAANELILDQEVAVLMGGITSASRESVRPVVDRNPVVYFYNEQYEGGVCDKYVFNTGVVPTQQLETLIPWAIENVGPKFYTLAADYNYGQISADWVRKILGEEGGELLGTDFIPLDVAEFRSTLNTLQEARPDTVMSLLVGGSHIAFYRQFAAAGLRDQMKIVSPTFGLGNEQVVLSPDESAEITVAYPYYQELETAANEDFVGKWHERFGEDYPYITDSANVVWTGWHLWAQAVEKAGSIEMDPVIEALESGLSFEAPEGPVTMDGPSHHLVHNVHIARANDQNGFDIIETFEGVEPGFEQEVCDLVAEPDQHTQFTP